MARQYFPDVDPLGQRFAVGTEPDQESTFAEIVGIVSDVAQSFEAGAKSEFYLPYGQYPVSVLAGLYRNVSLVIRTSGEPMSLVPSVRAALQSIDRDQPLVRVRTMEQAIGDTVAQPRLQALLLAIFASVAVALAVVGVYGVMAYVVSQRTQEIGVRVALGASRSDVVRMVVAQAARLAALGIAIGLVGAVAAVRALQSLLFATSAFDPLTFVRRADRPRRGGTGGELSAGTSCGRSRADHRAGEVEGSQVRAASRPAGARSAAFGSIESPGEAERPSSCSGEDANLRTYTSANAGTVRSPGGGWQKLETDRPHCGTLSAAGSAGSRAGRRRWRRRDGR